MTDVPNVTREEVTVRARHRFFLEGPFHGQKAASKLLNDPFYATLRWQIKQLAGSDPKHDQALLNFSSKLNTLTLRFSFERPFSTHT
jgi:hypothetical protein